MVAESAALDGGGGGEAGESARAEQGAGNRAGKKTGG